MLVCKCGFNASALATARRHLAKTARQSQADCNLAKCVGSGPKLQMKMCNAHVCMAHTHTHTNCCCNQCQTHMGLRLRAWALGLAKMFCLLATCCHLVTASLGTFHLPSASRLHKSTSLLLRAFEHLNKFQSFGQS